jgi:catalase
VAQPAPWLQPDKRAQGGDYLTTKQGARLPDTDHSLKAGTRGPTLLEDVHFREKITAFDHERIPERAVHARGAAAHGVFRSYGTAGRITSAAFLADKVDTPVFVRFSTVLGSRGSADTVRDVRGFSTKFYTAQGNFDLVGNNMPVFFIQDGIKFPDLIHAAKPHPDREIPQAQTAHDTFWDFVSLHTESMHQVIWAMSDRGIPRSYRTMQGFGIHTFRLVNADGDTVLVKFHWTPVAGVHSLVWEEAQLAAGFDPDFHRRDLADAIENGAFPQYELGVQVLPDTPEETFEGIDLLDPTKLIPEELSPVQPLGMLTLDRNPTYYFGETEQVAYCTSHLVPGIQVTNDPLLQARMFSYLDTQLSRLGGPNFTQIPINRPHVPVNDNTRDGMHQTAIFTGLAPYLPNTIDGGAPAPATASEGAYITLPTPVTGVKGRGNPVSFDDHYSQAAMFWASMSDIEQQHIVEAYTFELAKVFEKPIRERVLVCLASIDTDLATRVAAGLGLPVPDATPPTNVVASPAVSQVITTPGPVTGRVVGVIVTAGADLAGVAALRKALVKAGAVLRLIAPVGGELKAGSKTEIVERTLFATRSIEYDAVVVAAGTTGLPVLPVTGLLDETFRHAKTIAAWGDGTGVLTDAGIDTTAPGVLVAEKASADFANQLIAALGLHRAWDRLLAVPAL